MTRTNFRPDIHGFAFSNSWTLDDAERERIRGVVRRAVTIALLPLGPLAFIIGRSIKVGLPDTYGLCGGMAYASLDYYKRGVLPPRGVGLTDQPTRVTPEGTSLRDYFWRRLIDSLGTEGGTFLELMARQHINVWPLNGGEARLLARSRQEWVRLKALLDAGEPCPLGLIGTTKDPFQNHLVLAYGYDDRGDGAGRIYIYDSNRPDYENTIDLDLRGPARLMATESSPNSRRGPLRCFFCETYSAQVPPAVTTNAFQPPPATSWAAGGSMGEGLQGRVAVGRNAGGQLHLFGRRTDNINVLQWQVAPPEDRWSTFLSFGPRLASNVAVARNADDRLEIFASGADNRPLHKRQLAPNGDWSDWEPFGALELTGDPAVGRDAGGRLHVFVRGSGGASLLKWQLEPSGNWSGWVADGGVLTSNIAVGRNADGRLELLAVGTDSRPWRRYQLGPNGNWSDWVPFGNEEVTGDPSLGQDLAGRLHVFIRGPGGASLLKWQQEPSGNWSEWVADGGALTSNVAVGRNADGGLHIFARGADEMLWQNRQITPNGNWSGWQPLGATRIAGDPAVGQNQDGRLIVFILAVNGTLWHFLQAS
ncbi:MAG: hypothetical protein HY680_03765 [Chloroflexi bacterium]|nr:hypothetical protein [Chloroflexota bacterium]